MVYFGLSQKKIHSMVYSIQKKLPTRVIKSNELFEIIE